MGSDMIVALREASANNSTLFGVNLHAPGNERHAVQIVPGQMHDPGEVAHTTTLEIAQVRQTFAALGVQPIAQWGFTHGVNENRVAIGVTEWRSRLNGTQATLNGADLVRLALERSHGAHHAVEIVTDLLERHGQNEADAGSDNIFLIADANEAYVLETAGRYWALLECGHTRVVTDVAMIRQDWRRLAPGLADLVIEKGWWHDDGSKIDFVRCLGDKSDRAIKAQKRWGHASLALAQQQGAIDLHFLRRMLGDYYTQNRDFLSEPKATTLAGSFLVDLHKSEQPLITWVAFGTPKTALYFPLCLVGQLPAGFADGIPASPSIQQRTLDMRRSIQGNDRGAFTTTIERLQTKFDQDAEDFLLKAHDYAQHGKPYLIGQIATEMMQSHVELFDKEYRRSLGIADVAPQRIAEVEEVLYFA